MLFFFYACKLFGLRAYDEHAALECDQFTVGEYINGRYINFNGKSSRNYKGGLKHRNLQAKNIKHYSSQPDSDRCVVRLFETYLNCVVTGRFYRRPLAGSTLRFSAQPIRENTFRNLMREMTKAAGITGNFTNHSGKRTCATQLFQAG